LSIPSERATAANSYAATEAGCHKEMKRQGYRSDSSRGRRKEHVARVALNTRGAQWWDGSKHIATGARHNSNYPVYSQSHNKYCPGKELLFRVN